MTHESVLDPAYRAALAEKTTRARDALVRRHGDHPTDPEQSYVLGYLLGALDALDRLNDDASVERLTMRQTATMQERTDHVDTGTPASRRITGTLDGALTVLFDALNAHRVALRGVTPV